MGRLSRLLTLLILVLAAGAGAQESAPPGVDPTADGVTCSE